jgi:hypothetical protein
MLVGHSLLTSSPGFEPQLDVSVRFQLPNLTYIVVSNEETPEEAQVDRQYSKVLRTVWGKRFERASYQDG